MYFNVNSKFFWFFCYRFCVCVAVDFSAVLGFVVVGNFRFVFCFVDAFSHVSAAAGALRFFACPKKVTKKMAFTFFMKKSKTK
ncbi:MAG: hypothetical protein R3Y27_08935, partial [Clostridia bacterium]